MDMKNHTRIDLVEGGSIFKQGEHAQLAFNPRDYSGKTVDLTGKDIAVAIWNSKGIMYEGAASFDSTAQLIRLTINQLLQHGDFQIEFTVTDAADPDYRRKFPSGEYEGKIYIKPSADNIDFIGVSMTTVAQLRTEQDEKQQQFELAIVPQVDELKQRVEQGIGAFTEDTEVLDARMGETNLRQFNEKTIALLAEKAEDSEVRKKTVPIGLNDAGTDLLAALDSSGGSTFSLLSIPREKSVDGTKTTFIKNSTNLFNKSDVVTGKFIGSDGTTGTNVTTSHTKFMPVTPGKTYYFYGFTAVSKYSESQQFQGRDFLIADGQAYTVPLGCLYIILNFTHTSGLYLNKRQINAGSALLPYEEWKMEFKDVSLPAGFVTPSTTSFLTEVNGISDVNKFNKTNVTAGGYYDYTTFQWVANSGFSQSEFIDVVAGDVITIPSLAQYANYAVFKDSAGAIFSGLNILANASPRSFTAPAGAVSVSIHMRNEFVETFMIVINQEFPNEYVAYRQQIQTVEISNANLNQYILDHVSANLDIRNETRFTSVNFLGDSITYGYSPYDGTKLPIIWADLVGEALNIPTVRNYGVSGSTLGSLADESRAPMVNRYTTMDNNADLVCVFGGRNDWNFEVPLGTFEDTTKFTFYGALKIMMDGLYTKYPNATIVFFTPLHGSDSTNHATKGDIIAYRNAVIEVGARYGIAVLDLYATSGLYPENATNYAALVPDGRHPNEAGHRKLAHRITGFLRTL